MRYIIIDFEMQMISRAYKELYPTMYYQEIIEIGAIMLNESFDEIKTFQTYVRPAEGVICQIITALTGITTENVSDAPTLKKALEDFSDWCGDDECRVYAWSDADLNQLRHESESKCIFIEQIEYLMRNWHDFQHEYCQKIGVRNQISLSNAINSVGQSFEGKMHDALNDARATANLFRLVHNEKAFMQASRALRNSLDPKPMTYTLADRFGDLLTEYSNLCTI